MNSREPDMKDEQHQGGSAQRVRAGDGSTKGSGLRASVHVGRMECDSVHGVQAGFTCELTLPRSNDKMHR